MSVLLSTLLKCSAVTGYVRFCGRLLNAKQLYVEHERGVWRNHARITSGAVSQLWRDPELPLTSNFHSSYAFVPTLDYLSTSQCEPKGRAANRTVELLAGGEPAGVVHLDFLPGRCGGAFARNQVPVLQSRGSCGSLACNFARSGFTGLRGSAEQGASRERDRQKREFQVHHYSLSRS